MENKNYINIQNLSSTNNNSNSDTTTTLNSYILPSTTTTTTTPSLQVVPSTRPIDVYSDNNGSNIVITQPTYNKLLSETIKQEQVEENFLQVEYSTKKNRTTTEQYSSADRSKINNTQQLTTLIPSVLLNSRETLNGLPAIPVSMANLSHLTPTLNPTGAGTYYVSGLPNDLTSSYKLPPSSNSDLPSPSTSSNSSNPSSSNHHHNHQGKRHGEGGDPTRKRAVRLQKNREAARECRRKKKEYIKCLEERVTGLENQNKALIEELRQLKELYCQREDTTNNKTTTTTR